MGLEAVAQCTSMTEDDRILVSGWTIITMVDTDLCARELHINLSTRFKQFEDFRKLKESVFLACEQDLRPGGGRVGAPILYLAGVLALTFRGLKLWIR